MEKGLTFKVPGWTIGLNFKLAAKRREGTTVIGVTNKVGHYYVPFFDYDIKQLDLVEADIRSLQEEFLLGDMFLFRTGKGYHVIGLDLLTGEEWRVILSQSNCDEEFKSVPYTNGAKTWVLRTTAKKSGAPKYEKRSQGFLGRNMSRPHYDYLIRRGVPPTFLEPLRIYTMKKEEALVWATYEA
jgi:hypothetical protein